MTDLTDKYKARTIEAGAYYVLLATDEIFPDVYNSYGYFEQFDNLVEKVLASVPSYDDWMATRGTAVFLMNKNTQLKEILKECRYIMGIEKEFSSCHVEKDKLCKLLTKINRALGEDNDSANLR